MAIIGKIQEKGRYLLVGIVGLALLTFILTSLFDVLGTRTVEGNLGTIAGDPVAVDDAKYRDNLNMAMADVNNRAAQQGQQPTDMDRQQAEDRAWQQTVDDILLGKEFEALGVEVSDRELIRLNDLREHHVGSEGALLPWLDHEIEEVQQRRAWFQNMWTVV